MNITNDFNKLTDNTYVIKIAMQRCIRKAKNNLKNASL